MRGDRNDRETFEGHVCQILRREVSLMSSVSVSLVVNFRITNVRRRLVPGSTTWQHRPPGSIMYEKGSTPGIPGTVRWLPRRRTVLRRCRSLSHGSCTLAISLAAPSPNYSRDRSAGIVPARSERDDDRHREIAIKLSPPDLHGTSADKNSKFYCVNALPDAVKIGRCLLCFMGESPGETLLIIFKLG